MNEEKTMQQYPINQRDISLYIIGFVLSLVLIVVPYALVTQQLLSGQALIAALIGCGLLQLFVQLVCFLRLGRSTNGHWNILVFLFMAIVILIVVIGSLWIMDNLNYNMMPDEMNQYMLEQNKKGF